MRVRRCLALVLGALAACSTAGEGEHSAGTAGEDVDAGHAREDAGSEKDPVPIAIPFGDDPEVLTVPLATALPLGRDDVLALSEGDAIDMSSGAVVSDDGSVIVAFDRSDVALSSSTILVSHSRNGVDFSVPKQIPIGAQEPGTEEPAIVANPSLVRTSGTFFYYTTTSAIDAEASLFRRALSPKGLGPPELLPALSQGSWLLSWPKFHGRTDGNVGVAYRTTRGVATYGLSEDDASFSTHPVSGTDPAAMAHAAELGDGSRAFSYQQGPMTEMVSYVTTSKDGITWTERQVVADATNVHDTSMCRRADGGLDLYYIYPTFELGFARGFRLFRRALHPDGRLGPEQRITSAELGEPSKPSALRLSNGHVLVSYAQIAVRGSDGAPAVQRIVLALLPGDAP